MADISERLEGARYDAYADWYIGWIEDSPGLVCDSASGMMAARLDGQRWLDVACGAGRTSRELARRGATVVGVDISENLIAIARTAGPGAPQEVSFAVANVAQLTEWWDGGTFDGAVCEMALMDIDDLVGTVAAVAQVVKPDSPFLISMVNPCFPGNEAGLSSWPPQLGYIAEGFWTSDDHNPVGVRKRVGSNHRRLSTYLNLFVDAGFDLERVYEPPNPLPYWMVATWRRRRSRA